MHSQSGLLPRQCSLSWWWKGHRPCQWQFAQSSWHIARFFWQQSQQLALLPEALLGDCDVDGSTPCNNSSICRRRGRSDTVRHLQMADLCGPKNVLDPLLKHPKSSLYFLPLSHCPLIVQLRVSLFGGLARRAGFSGRAEPHWNLNGVLDRNHAWKRGR